MNVTHEFHSSATCTGERMVLKNAGGWLAPTLCPVPSSRDIGCDSYALGYDEDASGAKDQADHNEGECLLQRPLPKKRNQHVSPTVKESNAGSPSRCLIISHCNAYRSVLGDEGAADSPPFPNLPFRLPAEGMTRSQTIPLPLPKSHIHRTRSEVQLNEDTVAAEFRDICMFNRLVSGIQEKSLEQKKLPRPSFERERIDRQMKASLERIVRHRYEDISLFPSRVASTVSLSDDENSSSRCELNAGECPAPSTVDSNDLYADTSWRDPFEDVEEGTIFSLDL